MSTVQSYEQRMEAREIARAHLELELCKLEEARLKAEQAMAVRRQVFEEAAAAERQAAAAERQVAAELGAQGLALGAAARDSAALGSEAAVADLEASRLAGQLAEAATELAAARDELASQIGRLNQLIGGVAQESDLVRRSLREAGDGLAAVERLAGATARDVEILAAEAARTAELGLTQSEIESQLASVEREIRFVTQDQALAPAAMATLMTMKANGFRLQETISRDGLIAYFAKSDLEHQIAVRLAPAVRAGEDVGRWEALVETYGYQGEECLRELASIEATVEELEVGSLAPTSTRIYPKDDRSPRPRLRGILPAPPRRRRRSTPRRRREETRES